MVEDYRFVSSGILRRLPELAMRRIPELAKQESSTVTATIRRPGQHSTAKIQQLLWYLSHQSLTSLASKSLARK